MRRRVKHVLRPVALFFCLSISLITALLCVISYGRERTWVLWGDTTWHVHLGAGRVTLAWERIDLRQLLDVKDQCFLEAYLDERSRSVPWPDTDWERVWTAATTTALPRDAMTVAVKWRNGYLGPSDVVWGNIQPMPAPNASLFTWDRREVELPLTGMSLLAFAPVLAAAFSRLARQSRPGQFCFACGYDLRKTPTRCPECGAQVPEERAASRRSVGLFMPMVAAFLLVLVVGLLITISTRHGRLFALEYGRGDRAEAQPGHPLSLPTHEHVVWVEDGLLFTAFARHAALSGLSASDVDAPPLTRAPWLEPTYQQLSRGGANVHVVQLPVWIALLMPLAVVALWIDRVRRRGGFWVESAFSKARAACEPRLPQLPST